MGEYATFAGQRIKVGTCEDMLYLRADHARRLTDSDTDFTDPAVLQVVRFRFPWPDEDDMRPGDYEDPFRGLTLWGFEQLADLEHGSTQFRADNGYLVSLPCPEGPEAAYTLGACELGANNGLHRLHVARNGYGGPAALIQQAWRGGRLVGLARCNGCRAVYRLEDGAEERAAASIRAQADEQIRTAERNGTPGNADIGRRFHLVADRLLAGYGRTLVDA